MAGGRSWTQQEVDSLKFFSSSLGAAGTAHILKRSVSATARKAREVGAARRWKVSVPSKTKKDCLLFRDRGMTASQIAERLGITRNAVIGHWYRADRGL